MIRHTIDIVTKATAHVNPGQKPVIAADQPLFAFGKQIQWAFPENRWRKHRSLPDSGNCLNKVFARDLAIARNRQLPDFRQMSDRKLKLKHFAYSP
jgi:hypothetical protein